MKTLVEAQKEAWGNLPIIITITTKKWKIEGTKLKKIRLDGKQKSLNNRTFRNGEERKWEGSKLPKKQFKKISWTQRT